MLFTIFHVMSIVHMRIDDADGLVASYGTASTRVRESQHDLAVFVTQGLSLLNRPGENGLDGPIQALINLKNDMLTEQRDVAWRVDWLRTVNAQDFDLDGRVEAVIPDTLAAALSQLGLTPDQAQTAEDMINDGVSFNDAATAAQSDNPEAALDAIRLAELNEQIANWDSDNWAGLDELLQERRELVESLVESGEPLPTELVTFVAQQLTPRQILELEQTNPDLFNHIVSDNGLSPNRADFLRAEVVSGTPLDLSLIHI